jgi:hypothetical protein
MQKGQVPFMKDMYQQRDEIRLAAFPKFAIILRSMKFQNLTLRCAYNVFLLFGFSILYNYAFKL